MVKHPGMKNSADFKMLMNFANYINKNIDQDIVRTVEKGNLQN